MSKPASKNSKKFSYTPVNELPKLNKIPTEWDLKSQYYSSPNDPQIEKDVAYSEKVYAKFAKKYRSSNFTSNPRTLAQALAELNKMSLSSRIGKPTRYLALLTALDSGNEAASKKLQLLSQRLTNASNCLLFFNLELGKLSKTAQQKFLRSTELADHRYDLKVLFENAKHQLTEAEEKVLRQLGAPSYDMWIEATEKMLGKRSISYKGETIPLNAAFAVLNNLPFKEQPNFWKLITDQLMPLGEFVEHELTAVVTRQKVSDELRGYDRPYSAAVLDHEDDLDSVEALVEAVSTKGFKLSRTFYKLKAQLHNVEKLSYAQRASSLGKSPAIPFEQAVEICRDVFYGVNTKYGVLFDQILTNKQIDVYPTPGKRGGAFCWGDINQPTNVFLNQVDNFRSLETMAHEMGHAIHTERSKVQPPQYQRYSTTTAETASTLFEGLLFDAVLEQAAPSQKASLLHDKLTSDVATIQRQIACFNYELAMHETIREQGAMTHIELAQLMNTELKRYLGPAFALTEADGYNYVPWSHLRYGFYVYTYTFGILMSSIMAANFKADKGYAKQIDTFLTAGGSDTVANIFKSIGLNTKKIETFELGLDKMSADIALLKKLTR